MKPFWQERFLLQVYLGHVTEWDSGSKMYVQHLEFTYNKEKETKPSHNAMAMSSRGRSKI